MRVQTAPSLKAVYLDYTFSAALIMDADGASTNGEQIRFISRPLLLCLPRYMC